METVADVLMVVSGAPTRTPTHASNMANLALEILKIIKNVSDPTQQFSHVQIRIGKSV